MTHHTPPVGTTTDAVQWRELDVPARRAIIIALRDAGHDKHGIAAALGTTTDAVQGFCRRHQLRGVLRETPADSWYALTTPEKVARIRSLEADGKTQPQIAEELGISRNALHGFAWRHGLRSLSRRTINVAPRAPEVPADPVDPATWEPVAGEPVPFVENNGCAWPIGEDGSRMCCGASRMVVKKISAGGREYEKTMSYCEHHHRLGHRGGRQIEEAAIDYLAKLDAKGAGTGIKKAAAPKAESGKKIWRSEDE